ncbi:MAG: TraB/GumN family protein [Stellaceae bacterium]
MAGLILLLACRPAAAEPALWLARGKTATIYLFGTIHALKKSDVWEGPRIAKALAQSQELWLEIPDPDNRQEAQTLTSQFGFDPQHPLSSKVSPPVLAQLEAVAKAIGMHEGEKTLEPMRPWLASVALEDALLVRAGYDPGSGVEPLLLHQAVTAGKPVRGFETLAQQIHFFADMPPAVELQLLQNTLQDFDQGTREIDALVAAWMSGDEARITRIMVDEMRNPFPALYRKILVERNEAWAAAIAQMLGGSGVTFIAVGAAHLAGPDSVQAALKRRGIAVERVSAANGG